MNGELLNYFNKDLASSELARRYYGTKQFMLRDT